MVEAVGGKSSTTLRREDIAHHHHANDSEVVGDNATEGGILTHLLTRWTVRRFPFKPPGQANTELPPKEHTEVSLTIEYQFSNPMYSAMSSAVADKVAGVMIEAFEKRVKTVLDGGVDGLTKKGIDGVVHSGL